jgi:polynucleotide 5'-kinase involved in rRNA processing
MKGPSFLSLYDLQACTLLRAGEPHPRASMLLRLPPPDVSLIPEVRCAVVGNVDSGKSTILGVLTRGEFRLSYLSIGRLQPRKVALMMGEG